jgi:hypothetical protein
MRDVGQGVVQVLGLVAHLADLAGRIGALKSREVNHAQRQFERMNFG